MRLFFTRVALAAGLCSACFSPLPAQGFLKKMKDAAINGAKGSAPAKPSPDSTAPIAPAGTAAAAPANATTTAPASGTAEALAPGAGAWRNYDFVPGDRLIWLEDFADDEVGDFPHRMKLLSGNMEVVKVGDKKYLRTTTGGSVLIKLPEILPEQFTVEIHYASSSYGNPIKINSAKNYTADPDQSPGNFGCYPDGAWLYLSGIQSAEKVAAHEKEFVNCRFTVSGRSMKGYLNETRTANLPNDDASQFPRTNVLQFEIPSADADAPSLITDIRIAAGGKKLYDALSANGRVRTQGILFDTGSDRIRPESTPTLNEIRDMLTSHADLVLDVEGHTDNVGDAAANQTLSEHRAQAVVAWLTTSGGIDAKRLTPKGYGAGRPVATNGTPEGRQNNRRVELAKPGAAPSGDPTLLKGAAPAAKTTRVVPKKKA